MKRDVARQRYLARHIESGLPDPPSPATPWRHVLVLPAYRESPELLVRLARSLDRTQHCLAILLLNRPDHDPDVTANAALRSAVADLPAGRHGCRQLTPGSDLLCHDLELLSGATPGRQGVGLVRKVGCDLAVKWMAGGAIQSGWVCCTDADAILPADYFDRLQGVPAASGAAVFPFEHLPGPDPLCNAATALYELRLHHYVLGLEYAASPYAYHSLGSALAIRPDFYTRVRGFPRRSGGEDFYLLNKVNKLGPVTRLQGEAIGLESRLSSRVPFGTGPAVEEIARSGAPEQQPRFYHPMCFEALRLTLLSVPQLQRSDVSSLPGMLAEGGLDERPATRLAATLQGMGLDDAIDHCRAHAQSPEPFMRQFHQWFDAFRTLKFIHAQRDSLWPDQSLRGLRSLQPRLWPGEARQSGDIEVLRACIRGRWNWISPRRRPDW